MPLYLLSTLDAPKSILKAICNLQRYFLVGGEKKENKWDLVAWDKLFLPKIKGGLGLRYPETLSSVQGAKTWWRWLEAKDTLWAHLWHKEYYPYMDPNNII